MIRLSFPHSNKDHICFIFQTPSFIWKLSYLEFAAMESIDLLLTLHVHCGLLPCCYTSTLVKALRKRCLSRKSSIRYIRKWANARTVAKWPAIYLSWHRLTCIASVWLSLWQTARFTLSEMRTSPFLYRVFRKSSPLLWLWGRSATSYGNGSAGSLPAMPSIRFYNLNMNRGFRVIPSSMPVQSLWLMSFSRAAHPPRLLPSWSVLLDMPQMIRTSILTMPSLCQRSRQDTEISLWLIFCVASTTSTTRRNWHLAPIFINVP